MYRVREMGQVRQQKYGETGRWKVYRVREMGEVVQQKYGETGRWKVYRVREMGEVKESGNWVGIEGKQQTEMERSQKISKE